MPPAGWKIIGQTEAPEVERPEQPYAWHLKGDRFGLIVPLRWPLSHDLEDNLRFVGEAQIMALWMVFVARCMSFPEGAPDVVPFPESDEELAEYLPLSDGRPLPLDHMGWRPHPKNPLVVDRPDSWATLVRWWYQEQLNFGKKELAQAFADALEMLVGLPLERAAPLLHTYLLSGEFGEEDSGSKVTSISTRKKTAPKSGRSRTSSSPRTPTSNNGVSSTTESSPSG